jgi:hypothetical protein
MSALSLILLEKEPANVGGQEMYDAFRRLFNTLLSILLNKAPLNLVFYPVERVNKIFQNILDNTKSTMPLLEIKEIIKTLISENIRLYEFQVATQEKMKGKDPEYIDAIATINKLATDLDYKNQQEDQTKK